MCRIVNNNLLCCDTTTCVKYDGSTYTACIRGHVKRITCKRTMVESIDPNPNITEINCQASRITNLSGFKNLRTLNCSYTPIKTINGFSKLAYLTCIDSVNQILNCPSINYLRCNMIKIISMLYELEILDCTDSITELIIECPAIRTLYCNGSQLKSIDLLHQLEYLRCKKTNIRSIPRSNTMIEIDCRNTQVEVIDGFKNLRILKCSNSPVRYIGWLPKLCTIHCNNTFIISLIVPNNVYDITIPDTLKYIWGVKLSGVTHDLKLTQVAQELMRHVLSIE